MTEQAASNLKGKIEQKKEESNNILTKLGCGAVENLLPKSGDE